MIIFSVLTIVIMEKMNLNGIMLSEEHLIDLKEYQSRLKRCKNEDIGDSLNLAHPLIADEKKIIDFPKYLCQLENVRGA
jgi:hypothetical protein